MKYIFNIIFILFCVNLFSQTAVPDGINYQAVVRNSTGAIATSTTVNMKFELYEGTTTSVYTETVILNANLAGIVTHTIGFGAPVSGSFATINWKSGNIWYLASVLDGGSYYPIGLIQKFMTVPYSFYAKSAKDVPSSYSGNTLVIGNSTYTLNSGTTYTAGSGINISPSGVITNTAINTVSSGSNITVNPIATSTGTNYVVSTPSYSLAQSSGSITLYQGGTSVNSVSVSPGGIYGGGGALTQPITIANTGTNVLIFEANNSTAGTFGSIANFRNTSTTNAGYINVGSAIASLPAGINFKYLTGFDFGSIFGHTKGVTVSAGSYTNALTASNLGDVWLNAVPSSISEGRMVIEHTATTAYPTMHFKETSGNVHRIKFSNNSVPGKHFEINSQTHLTDNRFGAMSFSFNGDGGATTAKPILLINQDHKVYIGDYNIALTAFHVMTNTTTAPNGIMSEGFAQPGKLSLSRNNNTGGGIRLAVTNNQSIGELLFSGSDGTLTGMKNGAIIRAISTQPFTSTSFGTDLIFSTVKTDSANAFPRMFIRNNGDVEIKNRLFIPTSSSITIIPNAGSGKVLTSDAAGNATWENPATLTGPWNRFGTFITPTTGGDFVGIGINSPTSLLHVYINTPSTAAKIENNSTGIALDVKSNGTALNVTGTSGSSPAILSNATGSAPAATFSTTNFGLSDAVIIDNNRASAGLKINSSSTSTVGLHLNGGHIKSITSFSPTTTAFTSTGAFIPGYVPAITLNSNSTDVKGDFLITPLNSSTTFSMSGNEVGKYTFELRFNKSYNLPPSINITPSLSLQKILASSGAVGSLTFTYYVVSYNDKFIFHLEFFKEAVSPLTSFPLSDLKFNYFVIE